MSDKRKFKGLWWNPATPDVRWNGILTWKAAKTPKLKLTFQSEEIFAEPPEQVESFLGFDSDKERISLLRVGSGGTSGRAFLSVRRYHAGHIFRGIHFSSLAEFRATRIDIGLQYLGAWLGEEEGIQNRDKDGAFSVEYKRPEDRVFQISSGFAIKICHSSRIHSRLRHREISYDLFASVERTKPFEFSHAIRWINTLRQFLHFARLRPVFPTRITFEIPGHTFQLAKSTHHRSIDYYSGLIKEPIPKDPLFFDFVFTFQDIKERCTAILQQWFRFCVEQRESLDCYMTTVYTNLPCQIRLICLTQALEAFHQRKYRPKAKSEAMKFVNRIRGLCFEHEAKMSSVVGDIEAFAVKVRDSRHYYTHHDPALQRGGNVLKGSELTVMTYRLEYLFRLCVLSEFQLDSDPHQMLRRQLPARMTEFF